MHYDGDGDGLDSANDLEKRGFRVFPGGLPMHWFRGAGGLVSDLSLQFVCPFYPFLHLITSKCSKIEKFRLKPNIQFVQLSCPFLHLITSKSMKNRLSQTYNAFFIRSQEYAQKESSSFSCLWGASDKWLFLWRTNVECFNIRKK